MKKILLIQSRLLPAAVEAEQSSYTNAIGEGAELSSISSLDGSIQWHSPRTLLEGYDGIIIGGSGDFDLHGGRDEADEMRSGAREILERLRPLITYALETKKPILGICFGHQLIAEIYGGEIVSDDGQKKVGSHCVCLTQDAADDPLFSELPSEFVAQYGHADAVTRMPDGATLLASSPTCRFSALRYNECAYTTQFHPELSASDLAERFKNGSRYLPEGVAIESIVQESPEASLLIRRFVEKIV